MKKSLLMNFTVDKANKKILVEREFNADVKLVWSAWTESKLLDQWWAPKPWRAETKSMDFKEGGVWLYAMVGPEGEKHWARADYKKIDKLKSFSTQDAFCDEKGTINKDFPRTDWIVKFNSNGDETFVNVELIYKELADLEKIMEMGMKEGFTAALTNLDALLESKK